MGAAARVYVPLEFGRARVRLRVSDEIVYGALTSVVPPVAAGNMPMEMMRLLVAPLGFQLLLSPQSMVPAPPSQSREKMICATAGRLTARMSDDEIIEANSGRVMANDKQRQEITRSMRSSYL